MHFTNIAIFAKRRASLTFAALGLITLFFVSGNINAQEIPCLDARVAKTKFVKLTDKSLRDPCGRARFRNIKARTEGQDPVKISGHVTHQNGVRMSGVTMRLDEHDLGTFRTVVTDELGNYLFDNIVWGSSVELTPMLENYEFYPPAVIWEGIVEDEVWNFIAVGPPPPPPPPPANQPTLAWTSFFDNAPQLADFNAMIGRDAAGNVYTGGTSLIVDDPTGNTDIVLFKTDVNGNRVWSRTFNGAGNYREGLRDMAVDEAGNTYLTGYTYYVDGENPALNSYDYVTLKYNTDGDLVWTRMYSGNMGYDDFPLSLKIDSAGNTYVGGYSWGINTYANYATVKYDADGNQVWAKRYAGGYGEILNELEVDAAGNVYVTGTSNRTSAGGAEDIVTIKYLPDGTQAWFNRYNSPSDLSDEGYELEINAAGDVLILGESYDFDVYDTIIHKIDGASGTAVWTRSVTGITPDRLTAPTGLKLDPAGKMILSGMIYDEVSYDVDSFVAKLDAESVLEWSKIYDGPSDDDFDGDTKVTFDAAGNIYTAVSSEGFANSDIQVLKYLADGTLDWTYRFGNPYLGDDWVLDWQDDTGQNTILLDTQGNVYIAGNSYVPEQSTDLVAFKLEPVAQMRAAPFDFDGDGKADISVFRPETGYWYVLRSSDGEYTAANWGIETDVIVPGDYDGDGKFDPAVYRNGVWFVQPVSRRIPIVFQFGLSTDKPIPSDFDNDGKADFSVFRDGTWHSMASATGTYRAIPFGAAGDIPIPSDYDSNRRSDIAVFRGGSWYVQYQDGLPMASLQFGTAADKVVPADYDGDKKTDYAVFRQGTWYIWQSRTLDTKVYQWGIDGDIPVPADYDGDKKADIAVFRSGVWYILQSRDGQFRVHQFGLSTDIPVPSAYVR